MGILSDYGHLDVAGDLTATSDLSRKNVECASGTSDNLRSLMAFIPALSDLHTRHPPANTYDREPSGRTRHGHGEQCLEKEARTGKQRTEFAFCNVHNSAVLLQPVRLTPFSFL
mmetsp:Transcript_16998/g.22920  ORF Transcript_16998/g.22920 Transcript_16998/m.22920 type:complete len:114 (-) Transcript_16998:25-366(-)